jgi:hypothetical protein
MDLDVKEYDGPIYDDKIGQEPRVRLVLSSFKLGFASMI